MRPQTYIEDLPHAPFAPFISDGQMNAVCDWALQLASLMSGGRYVRDSAYAQRHYHLHYQRDASTVSWWAD